MTIKTFSLGMAIAIFSSLLTAGLAVMGTQYMAASSEEEAVEGEQPGRWGKVTAFFSRSEQAGPMQFVEMKNIVVTLRNDGDRERYMLLELALTVVDDDAFQRTELMLPAIRGATVALLSDMNYHDVRALRVPDMHDRLMEAYTDRFRQLNNSLPFTDVIISKMLLQ